MKSRSSHIDWKVRYCTIASWLFRLEIVLLTVQKSALEDGSYLAYKYAKFGHSPTVVFFGGFMSSMEGTKASTVFKHCCDKRIDCVCFDYLGHGNSSGEFEQCTLGTWLDNCRHVVENIVESPAVVVGSSMGGWLMLLTAMSLPSKVLGLIGLAPAPDFTETVTLDLTGTEIEELDTTGKVTCTKEGCCYVITKNLIAEGKRHLLLNRESIPVSCPITLIHGMNDTVVSYGVSIEIAKKVCSGNVATHLIKSADHRLSTEENLNFILKSVDSMLARVSAGQSL